jgi:hypothetical protein
MIQRELALPFLSLVNSPGAYKRTFPLSPGSADQSDQDFFGGIIPWIPSSERYPSSSLPESECGDFSRRGGRSGSSGSEMSGLSSSPGTSAIVGGGADFRATAVLAGGCVRTGGVAAAGGCFTGAGR